MLTLARILLVRLDIIASSYAIAVIFVVIVVKLLL